MLVEGLDTAEAVEHTRDELGSDPIFAAKLSSLTGDG